MKLVGQRQKVVLNQLIPDSHADAYTFHNLSPSRAYKVQVLLNFKSRNERILDYEWLNLDIGNRTLKPLPSKEVFFNTSQRSIDEFIHLELTQARKN
jgi:hypothetical protein